MGMRIGTGYDSHRFKRGRPLFIGGIKIPHSKGLAGHSDADVMLHAVIDALLGAAGLADIGTYFPNRDPKWKNVRSTIFLAEVAKMLQKKRAKVVNVDCVLIAESPKLAPYIPEIKKKISGLLKISRDCVGVKASTNEGMGFIGRKEGMACAAVALIQSPGRYR